MTETRACWQPWDSLNIAADGKVYPCCVVNPDLEIGDLNTETIEKIVSGNKAAALRRKILQGDIAKMPCLECCNAPMLPVEMFKRDIIERFFKAPEQVAPHISEAKAEPPNAPSTDENKVAGRLSIRQRLIRFFDLLNSQTA